MRKTLLLFAFPLLFSCGEIKKVDRSGMEAESANREIKVVKDSDILMMAQTIGETLASREFLDKEIRQTFTDSLFQKGISINYLLLLDTLSAVSPEELSLLQAYAYNVENGLTLESNLQIINKENYLYTYPKMKNDTLEAIVSILFSKREIVIRF